jgi:hypothetical protein
MNHLEGVFHDFVRLFERLNVPYAVMGGLAVRDRLDSLFSDRRHLKPDI